MLSHEKIIFIGPKEIEVSLPVYEKLEFINEDEIYHAMTFYTI